MVPRSPLLLQQQMEARLMSSLSSCRSWYNSKPLRLSCVHPRYLRCVAHSDHGPDRVKAVAKKYAVIGGGFAGVATAWHLLQYTSTDFPVSVILYDVAGIGGGASQAAAGLLHPFSPRGKVMWMGYEALADALQLVKAAEQGAAPGEDRFAWRQQIMRPASDWKQAQDFMNLPEVASPPPPVRAQALSAAEALRLLPGLKPGVLEQAQQVKLKKRHSEGEAKPSVESHAALLISGGLVLEPTRYLRALWSGCLEQAGAVAGCKAELRQVPVTSLRQLQLEEGPFDAIVVAAGAAMGCLPEIGDRLGLELCQGYSVELIPKPPEDSGEEGGPSQREGASRGGYPEGAPSLLGSTYICSQGGQSIIVGATKQFGYGAQQALEECGRQVNESQAQVQKAVRGLLGKAGELWGQLPGWQVKAVRSGVRAGPPRGPEGALPLLGRLDSESRSWVVGGLGARGLLYHAMLGRLTAEAIVKDDESVIPALLRRWNQP